ncbi:MAG: RIP metalloprotease RseP [Pseudomonadota bacterium]
MESILSIPLIGTLLPFLLVLGIVIFVHEYGHYIVGRWSGIHAEVFAIGFGPEIFGWTDRRGTRWKFCWIPLGGYVKFKGDANPASAPEEGALDGMAAEERRTTLQGAPLWAKAATVSAGPVANFILTIVVFALLLLAIGRNSEAPVIGEVDALGQAYAGGLRGGDEIISVDGAPIETYADFQETMLAEEGRIKDVAILRDGAALTLPMTFDRLTRIANVHPGSPAAFACIAPGDVIQKIDGAAVASFSELQAAVERSDGAEMAIVIERDGALIDLALTPEEMELPNPVTGEVTRRLIVGVSADFNLGVQPSREAVGLGEAIVEGLYAPVRIAQTTFGYLGEIFAGRADGSSLGGPIGIADASGRAAERGLTDFILLIATLSTAIGLINLFPIPILDGGHLVFYAIEAVRGKPLSDRYMEAAMTAGFVAILALLVFATSNDVPRTFGPLVSGC